MRILISIIMTMAMAGLLAAAEPRCPPAPPQCTSQMVTLRDGCTCEHGPHTYTLEIVSARGAEWWIERYPYSEMSMPRLGRSVVGTPWAEQAWTEEEKEKEKARSGRPWPDSVETRYGDIRAALRDREPVDSCAFRATLYRDRPDGRTAAGTLIILHTGRAAAYLTPPGLELDQYLYTLSAVGYRRRRSPVSGRWEAIPEPFKVEVRVDIGRLGCDLQRGDGDDETPD